jgi:MinD superfamily P-loop ATPase
VKEIVVISGKGGTGKTSLVAAFAALAGQAVLADCDVDAADLHLILTPEVRHTKDFSGGKLARVMTDKCIGCGRCREVCHFDAVRFNGPANDVVNKTYTIDPIACEGCSVCVEFCPVDAIEFYDALNGQWFISQTRFGTLVHARLTPGEENSGKLVSLIRKEAKRLAEEEGRDLAIVDGSPGIGCPVIASISGADAVLVVTEPTISGQHDLERVIALTAHFGIPTAVCINKYDINPAVAERIEAVAKEKDVPVLGKIPYDPIVTRAQLAGQSVVEYGNGALKGRVQTLWQALLDRAGNTNTKEG